MCGIVGYVGQRDAMNVLLSGLARLEYRGYDSAGIAIHGPQGLTISKQAGKLAVLNSALREAPVAGHVGIGHTRWATHGRPCVENAHPHLDGSGKIALVHNGIIENYAALRSELAHEGYQCKSETDSEVIVHLVEQYLHLIQTGQIEQSSEYVQTGKPGALLAAALALALRRLEGAWALALVCADEPDVLLVARKDSPLIIGLGEGENLVASDIPAVLDYTREVAILKDDELAVIRADSVEVLDSNLHICEPELLHVDWSLEAAEKGGYEHFMLKEIHEQPQALRATLRGRYKDGQVQLSELDLDEKEIAALQRVCIVACGTSYHAGQIAKTLIERWARLPVEVQASSEFRYGDPIIDKRTLVIAITQSGETADTLEGVREARAKGAKVIAISNVVGSRVTREADGILYTHAGPEIGVAATKTFTTQIAALNIVALKLAQCRGSLSQAEIAAVFSGLETVPALIEKILLHQDDIVACAASDCCLNACTSLFIGRGIGVPVAMEGALKLKEISYIHAEAYPAGEMKHGPIALITDEVPVVGIAVNSATYEKVMSNIQEVRARGARVILVGSEGNEELRKNAGHVFFIPQTDELLSPILASIPLQLLAYYTAVNRGHDPDQPRNLAKSVTVE
jgi:glucosamine--fructose-6-phosphate aminotransferase (isomerizing)